MTETPATAPAATAETTPPAASPAPVVAHSPRKREPINQDLVTELGTKYEEFVSTFTKEYTNKALKDAEAKAQKDAEAFQKDVAKNKVKPTDEEAEALEERKKTTRSTLKYFGVAVGVMVGLMVIASPPGIVASAISGLAVTFGATATGVTAAAAAAITANVTLAMGALLASAFGAAGYFAGETTGGMITKQMKADVGSRDFSVTEEQKKDLTKTATEKAKTKAAEQLVHELWTGQQSPKPTYKDAVLETSLEAFIRKLQVEGKTPEPALQKLSCEN